VHHQKIGKTRKLYIAFHLVTLYCRIGNDPWWRLWPASANYLFSLRNFLLRNIRRWRFVASWWVTASSHTDDIVLPAYTQAELAPCPNDFSLSAISMDLNVSWTKTRVQCLVRAVSTPDFNVQGQVVELVDRFCYLGSVQGSNGRKVGRTSCVGWELQPRPWAHFQGCGHRKSCLWTLSCESIKHASYPSFFTGPRHGHCYPRTSKDYKHSTWDASVVYLALYGGT